MTSSAAMTRPIPKAGSAHLLDQFDAVHSRHVEVGNQEVDLDSDGEFLQCLVVLGRLLDGKSALAENARNAEQDGRRVVDQEYRLLTSGFVSL